MWPRRLISLRLLKVAFNYVIGGNKGAVIICAFRIVPREWRMCTPGRNIIYITTFVFFLFIILDSSKKYYGIYLGGISYKKRRMSNKFVDLNVTVICKYVSGKLRYVEETLTHFKQYFISM